VNSTPKPALANSIGARPSSSVQRLDGAWQLAHDADNRGRDERWFEAVRPEARTAAVPGVLHRAFPFTHGVFWYYLRLAPIVAPSPGERVLVHFGAVDYHAEVWLNGRHVASHEGAETPFTGDVTDAFTAHGDNLLVVRVLNTCEQRIDGIVISETPHRAKGPDDKNQPGSSYNYGGIMGHVELRVVPAIRVEHLHVLPDHDSGHVEVIATIVNALPLAAAAEISLSVAPSASGQALARVARPAQLPVGTSEMKIDLTLAEFRRWDLDDPALYRAEVSVSAKSAHGPVRHDYAARFGFRDFRLSDGWFHLNGRRIFLRSTHTGNHMPVGYVVPIDPDFMYRDLHMAKSTGYNMVRFICGMPFPEQLDYCDEIGLMVYEECQASWVAIESAAGMVRFVKVVTEMIERDRNHPSVTIWGLLNECRDKPVFHHAVAALPMIRALDQSRLILLSSGRWDRHLEIGSTSNPGSTKWEFMWGEERADATPASDGVKWPPGEAHPGGYAPSAGDIHFYPAVPLPERDRQAIRSMGSPQRPVFLSEFGVGSLYDVIDEMRSFERHGMTTRDLDYALMQPMVDDLRRDFARYGLDALYPFPEDFLREAQERNARARRHTFDLVRSNPNLCGYNFTGMLDHGFAGEGAWSMDRRFKPRMAEVLQSGWAPLRWCLFVPAHGYAQRPFDIEAVLADDAQLPVGEHPVVMRIFSAGNGVVWERKTAVSIRASDGRRPFAHTVLTATIDGLPEGDYTLAACLQSGGLAADDRIGFRLENAIVEVENAPRLSVLGLETRCRGWLAGRGYACSDYQPGCAGGLVVVGSIGASAEIWRSLADAVEGGSRVLFLSSLPFKSDVRPLGDAVKAHDSVDWIYHKEIVAKSGGVFSALQAGGIIDLISYDQVWARDVFECEQRPDYVSAAGIAVGYNCPRGYDSGVVVGTYSRGQGRIVLNSMRVEDNVDRHPAADRLLVNLLAEAAPFTQAVGLG
jgi:hypothetical protein